MTDEKLEIPQNIAEMIEKVCVDVVKGVTIAQATLPHCDIGLPQKIDFCIALSSSEIEFSIPMYHWTEEVRKAKLSLEVAEKDKAGWWEIHYFTNNSGTWERFHQDINSPYFATFSTEAEAVAYKKNLKNAPEFSGHYFKVVKRHAK